MKKGLIISLAVLLVVGLILGGCSNGTSSNMSSTPAKPSASEAAAGGITLKLGYDTPPTTALGVSAELFAKKVNAQTNGRVKVQTYPAGTLVSQGTSLQALRTGVADAYLVSISANLDSFPILNFTSLPGLNFFPDTIADQKAEVDTMRAIIAKYPAAQEELEGLKLLWSNTYTAAVLMGKKQIHVPDDVVGTKVGCTGLAQDTIKALNGVPVFTVPPEMYQQMQTGVIDSATVAWGVALEWQLQEQVKNVMDFSFGGGQLPVFVTEAVWSKIPPEDQQIMMNVAAQAEQANREYNQNQKQEAQAKWKSLGIPVYTPTPEEQKLWMEKFSIIWEQYLSKNKSAGVTDIDAIFNEWKTASLTPRTK